MKSHWISFSILNHSFTNLSTEWESRESCLQTQTRQTQNYKVPVCQFICSRNVFYFDCFASCNRLQRLEIQFYSSLQLDLEISPGCDGEEESWSHLEAIPVRAQHYQSLILWVSEGKVVCKTFIQLNKKWWLLPEILEKFLVVGN